MMSPEEHCKSCKIVTSISANCNKQSPYNPNAPGHTVYADLLPSFPSLTPSTQFKCNLWLVDCTSRYSFLVGLQNYTSEAVIAGLNKYLSATSHPLLIEPPELFKNQGRCWLSIHIRRIENCLCRLQNSAELSCT